MFWLSHHRPDEWNRTFLFGGLRICARCLGTYPALFAGIAAQVALRAPVMLPGDLVWPALLTLPALLDWARGRCRPEAGNNAVRTGSGVLLGLALGRTVYVHLRSPFPDTLLIQGGLVLAVAVPVLLLVSWRKRD